jgi:hypothetical protein
MRAGRRYGLLGLLVPILSLVLGAAPASAFRYDEGAITGAPGSAPAPGPFGFPFAVAADGSNDLWVSDTGKGVLDKFDSSGSFLLQASGVGGWAPTGSYLQGMAVDTSSEAVYVADSNHDDIWKLNAAGTVVGSIHGDESTWGAGCCYINVSVDNTGGPGDGELYISSGERGVFRVNPSGAPVNFTASGDYITGNQLTGIPTGQAVVTTEHFSLIKGVAIGPNHDIYVLTRNPTLVHQFDAAGNYIRTFNEVDGDTIRNSSDISIDPTNGHVLVAQEAYPSAVWEFESDGSFLQEVEASPAFSAPTRLAVAPSGSLYVSDGQVVKVFSKDFPIPKITYGAPTDQTQTSAVVHASIDPNNGGPVVSCQIEYGPDNSYGSTAPCSPDPSGGSFNEVTDVSATISGLTTEQEYHYRFVAGNADAVRRGADRTIIPHWVMGLETEPASEYAPTSVRLNGRFTGNGAHTTYHFEWGKDSSYGNSTPEEDAGSPSGPTTVGSTLAGLAPVTTYHYRVAAKNPDGESKGDDEVFTTPPLAPVLSEWVTDVHSDSVLLHGRINPGGGPTTYHFEYVDETQFEASGFTEAAQVPLVDGTIEAGFEFVEVDDKAVPVQPGTTYHYRLVATNSYRTVVGEERTFRTFAYGGHEVDPCGNSLVRQQTGAALLADCRAFELMSAPDTAGYDVESDIVPGQAPFEGFPEAVAPSRVLYGMHQGAVPGGWNPTNLGLDPYVATRGGDGWTTQYVGLPADGMPSAHPFGSSLGGADDGLNVFAFAGADICSPCFSDGTSGLPLRMPDGSIVQGMAGSLDPGPGATGDILVRKRFSGDGSQLVFGSTAQFEPDSSQAGSPSIYERDLATESTRVVSRLPDGENIPCLLECDSKGIAELDISGDGSRVLIGQLVSTDSHGNDYWHLYLEVNGSPFGTDLMPGASSGGMYAGMDSSGSHVYFTTRDQLASDTDTSVDLYRADVDLSGASLTRVSVGDGGAGDTDQCIPALNNEHAHWNTLDADATCDIVAIGGGGGVARQGGDVFFLSPETLEGSNGVHNAPNLYRATPGDDVEYVTTLESSLVVPQPPPAGHPFIRSFGSLDGPSGIGFDPVRDYVYVLEPEVGSGKVGKFDSKGHPVRFTEGSEAGTNVLTGTDGGGFQEYQPLGIASQLAVDNSTGDFFVPSVFDSAVKRFTSAGEFVTSLSVPFASAVAIDQSSSEIYAASYFGTIMVFDQGGSLLREFGTISTIRGIGVDPDGNVYVANGKEAVVLDSSGTFLRKLDVEAAKGLSVDPLDGHVYVDEGGVIKEFDPAGDPASNPFGGDVLSDSTGVAANAGMVLATDTASGRVSVWGPTAVLFNALYDNPLVLDSVGEADARRTGDFQVTADGRYAVFVSKLPLTGYDNDGHIEVYRFDAQTGSIDCASCPATGARTTGDAHLAARGLSLSDKGWVFFNSTDPLTPSDLNGAQDVFEWEDEEISPVSPGTSPIDSSLLSISADGRDAYFFTRQTLAPQDENGNSVKIYDARAGGGFPFDLTPPPCKASDECHGPGTQAPPPPDIGTYLGSRGNAVVEPPHRHRRHRSHRHHPKHHHHKKHRGRRHG